MSFRGLSEFETRRLVRACRDASENLRRCASLLRASGFEEEAAHAAAAASWLDSEADDIDGRTQAVDEGAGGRGTARATSLAVSWRGTPYVWGGTTPGRGLDCSGLVQVAYARAGIRLPRTSRQQAGAGVVVTSMAQARLGDLLFYGGPVHHVAIYLGGGRMVEAPRRGLAVRVVPVRSPTSIRRVA